MENEAIQEFGTRWIGVRSKHDEAILLLKRALALNSSIAPQWRSKMFWSYSREGATKVPGRIPKKALNRTGPSEADPAFYVHPNSWLWGKDLPDTAWKMQARKWFVITTLYWPIDMLREVMRMVYGRVISPKINSAADTYSKSRLLGDDSPYSVATCVTDVPSRKQDLCAADLPPNVEEDLLREANANAKAMISDVRQNYFSQLALTPTADVLGAWQNVETDPMRALVHCLYFEHRSCQDLIAAALSKASGNSQKVGNGNWLVSADAKAQELVESVSGKS